MDESEESKEEIQIEKEIGLKELEIDQSSSGSWQFSSDVISSAKDSDAIVLVTEWNEYKEINWKELTATMRKPAWIFDTRIIFSKVLRFFSEKTLVNMFSITPIIV